MNTLTPDTTSAEAPLMGDQLRGVVEEFRLSVPTILDGYDPLTRGGPKPRPLTPADAPHAWRPSDPALVPVYLQAKPKVYISSRLWRAPRWRAMRGLGVDVCSSWLWWEGDQPEANRNLWIATLQDVTQADLLIIVTEPGENCRAALVETGMAFACSVPVYQVGSNETLDGAGWQEHPLYSFASSPEEAIENWLADWGHLQRWERRLQAQLRQLTD